jgi:hypothetical protein
MAADSSDRLQQVGDFLSPRNFPWQASETDLRTALINIFYAWAYRT